MDRVASRGASRLISNFLVDSRLCHSISIAISKKFLGMESHTFSSKEQNGMKFHKKNKKIVSSVLLLSSDRLENVSWLSM